MKVPICVCKHMLNNINTTFTIKINSMPEISFTKHELAKSFHMIQTNKHNLVGSKRRICLP